MASSRERIQKALDSLLYLPHLQAQHDDPSLPTVAAPAGAAGLAAAGRGRPWDRSDLFRRLATFKSSTWFCKPDVISPVECARRGWTNTAADLLTCEFCKAKVSCPIPPDLLPQQAVQAGQRYAASLGGAHDAACPWRTGSSALSLLQFPPLTQEAVRRDFDARRTALQRLVCLPPVAEAPYATLAAAASKQRLDQLLLQGPQAAAAAMAAQLAAGTGGGAAAAVPQADAVASVSEGSAALQGTPAFEARARLLALCGWDVTLLTTAAAAAAPGGGSSSPGGSAGSARARQQKQRQEEADDLAELRQQLPAHVGPDSAALLCSLCNAKAGLWTFFPQCQPRVLQVPRRRHSSGGGAAAAAAAGAAASPSAVVHKSVVSRNVAAAIGATIAGGSMQAPTAAAAAAAPFGSSSQQPPLFGGPPSGSSSAAAGDARIGGSAAAGAAAAQQPAAAAPAAASPFGSGGSSGAVPAFGFAAFHASKPAAASAAAASASPVAAAAAAAADVAAAAASLKRKQPDFSWSTVMADIDAKAAAVEDKRRKAAAVAASSTPEAVAAAAAADVAAAAAARQGQQPSQQQGLAAAAAAASKYKAVQAAPLDPLALHRPFCPWVNCTQAGEKEGRCGWRWCLQQLAAPAAAAAAAAAAAEAAAAAAEAGEGEGGSSGSKAWDPAKLLRTVLQQVDIHK